MGLGPTKRLIFAGVVIGTTDTCVSDTLEPENHRLSRVLLPQISLFEDNSDDRLHSQSVGSSDFHLRH